MPRRKTKKLLLEYEDKVNYVVRHLPADIHPFALKSAEAVECARDQGNFMEYHNLLLEQRVQSLDDLYAYGVQLGFNESFAFCLRSGKKFNVVEDHVLEAATHNVRGTPTFFINGRKLEGVQEYARLKLFIEGILQNA